jgi:polysaccharide export outer membrane protein
VKLRVLLRLLLWGLPCLLMACATLPPDPTFVGVSHAPPSVPAASDEIIQGFEASANTEYLLGPGDVIELVASQWPEVAGEYVVSPDGAIAVYLAGGITISGLPRAEAETLIRKRLSIFYDSPTVTLRIKSFENNQIIALGRVTNPGILKFKGRPTFLEALAKAGLATSATRLPEVCALIRGKEQVVWIDLERFLRSGSTINNITLANNDILYIPDLEESNVFVLGEVTKPGAYALFNASNLVSAIAQAGGPTENAAVSAIRLVRNKGTEGAVQEIDLGRIVMGDYSKDYLLKKNDIVYVPMKGIATLNYYLRQLNPAAQIFVISKSMGVK